MSRKRQDDAPDAYARGVGLLARREHSVKELKTKLAARGYARADADAAVERLQDADYQSEARFGESLARRRAAQGYGPRRITAELAAHGLGKTDIAAAIEAADADWTVIASEQLRKRFGAATSESTEQRAAHAAFLLRRGFDPATVRTVTRAEPGDPDVDAD